MNEYTLIHGGPGSGRYPLGSGERPYQKLEGSRRKSSGGISGYIRSRKAKKQEAQAQKAKAEAEEKLRNLEENRERVLRSGRASEVLKYQGQLSNAELQHVADRLRLENQIQDYSMKEMSSGLDKLKTIQSYTNVSSALAKDGVDLWNSFAAIYNATPKGQSKPLAMAGARQPNQQASGGKKKK